MDQAQEPVKRRLVQRAPLRVCLNGHVAGVDGPIEDAWEIQCPACDEWTWEDGRFCTQCGWELALGAPQWRRRKEGAP